MNSTEFFTEAARQLIECDLTAETVSPYINRQCSLIRTALCLVAGMEGTTILAVADEVGELLAAASAAHDELPEEYVEAARHFPRRVAEAMIALDPAYGDPMTADDAAAAHRETNEYAIMHALGLPIGSTKLTVLHAD